MRDARSSPYLMEAIWRRISSHVSPIRSTLSLPLPHFFLWRHRGATILYHFLSVIVIKLKSNA